MEFDEKQKELKKINTKKKTQKIIFIILVVIVLTILAIAIESTIKASNLAFSKYRFYIMNSEAQSNIAEQGDLIIAKKTDHDNINVGDNIVYHDSKYYYCDNIIETRESDVVEKTMIIERAGIKYKFTPTDIDGIVVKNISHLGNIIMFLKTITGIVLFVLIMVCIFVILRMTVLKNKDNVDDSEISEGIKKLNKIKKLNVYLIMLFIILAYIGLFLIHNIDDRGLSNMTTIDSNVLDESEDNSVDNDDRFKIYEGDSNWKDLKQLDIFKNGYFKEESKIAPRVRGTYNFTVENYTDNKLIYDILFTEDNPYKVNMVYKLKVNGNYVAGNENRWGDYEELSKKSLLIDSKKSDLFTLEWRWQDAQNDTEIGTNPYSYYRINIKINAESIANE